MSKNSEYVSAMQAQMKQFDKDVDALGAAAGARARATYDQQVVELRAHRDAAQKQLVQLQAASESAGTTMHAGMQAAWDTMQAALKKVSADLRK
jgi:hypothetical protein